MGDAVTRLDRTSSRPLWAQLEAELRARLVSGEFDTRFPTDLELTRSYEVSRHTVREAVGHLQREGLLKRERGRGSVVEKSEFEQRVGVLYSLFAEIEAAGVEQRSDVLHVGIVTDSAIAARLQLADGAELFRLDRVRYAGDEPLALDRAWLPAEFGRPLLDVDFSHTALYDELDARGGGRPDQGWERISPVIPHAEERTRLSIGDDQAAFRVERFGQIEDRPLEWRVTVIRGDRYRFFSDWSPGTNGVLRLGSGD